MIQGRLDGYRATPRSPPTSPGLWELPGIQHSVIRVKLIVGSCSAAHTLWTKHPSLTSHTPLSGGRNLAMPGAVSAVPLRPPLTYPQPCLVLSAFTNRHT